MSRLIDSDMLIEEINSYRMIVTGLRSGKGVLKEYAHHSREGILKIIDEQPTVNDWILVSENGYPKEKGWYQCTCDDRKVGDQIWPNHTTVRDLFWNPNRNEFVDNVRYSESGHKDIEKYFWTKYVTAWQPLPDPYQPEGGNS